MLFRELAKFLNIAERKENLPPRSIIDGVPYYSQWESPPLVRKIIRDEILAQDDPLWRKSGAKSREEYELWAGNMCGMACLKMIVEHKFGKRISIITLGKRCMEFGGYIERGKTINGLYYRPFIRFIEQEFELQGKVIGNLSLNRIMKELSQKNYVVASVSHKIRYPDVEPVTNGGHLILMLGYDLDKEILLFHNPSGDTTENQEYAKISFSRFSKFFAGRGIIIER